MKYLARIVVVASVVSLGPATSPAQQGAGVEERGAPLLDGVAIQGDQFPRFIRPTHEGEFGFDHVLVVGDYPTVRFERRDLDQESGVSEETWTRVDVAEIAGRLVSVFRPVWSRAELEAGFRSQRWGVDRSTLFWGQIVAQATAPPEDPSEAGPAERRDVYLQLAPTNLPASAVVRVSDTVQYASHAVNIWVPGFAESRIRSGDTALDLPEVTGRFYEVFSDTYDTLAVVSQTALFTSYLGFRENVQNAIGGIGMSIFDDSSRYGSTGVLQGVEVYPPGGWATSRATLHQQAHQWGEYSAVWEQLGIVRQGDDPQFHLPLITPEAVMTGAVLEATRRVGLSADGVAVIQRTLPTIAYHPLTLYRMGLVGASALPEMRVFVEQGQFGTDHRSAPDLDTAVVGEQVPVFFHDILGADGERIGPVVDRVRRGLIYVSRDGLASQEEMDVVNYYAARAEATQGVASWDQYPSFFEATGGRAVMASAIVPRSGLTPEGQLQPGPVVTDLEVAPDALTGVLLDAAIPGRLSRQEPLRLSGTVTASDRDDFSIVCFRFIRYGSTDPNEVFVCSSLVGNRFSVDVTFTDSQGGSYTVEPFLFWPDSGSQLARARYGVIVIE